MNNININSLARICAYIKYARTGIALIEVNATPLQLECINYIHDNSNKELSFIDVGEVDNFLNLAFLQKYKGEIFIFYNFQYSSLSEKEIVRILNLYRDTIPEFKKIFIFLLPSYLVDEVYVSNASFKSCISVHEKYLIDEKCILKPILIKDSFKENNRKQSIDHLQEMKKIVEFEATIEYKIKVLTRNLIQAIEKYDKENINKLIKLFERRNRKALENFSITHILSIIADENYDIFDNGGFKKALFCYEYLYNHYNNHIDMVENAVNRASCYYHLEKYDEAINILLSVYKDNIDKMTPDKNQDLLSDMLAILIMLSQNLDEFEIPKILEEEIDTSKSINSYNQSIMLMQVGNYSEAEKVLNKINKEERMPLGGKLIYASILTLDSLFGCYHGDFVKYMEEGLEAITIKRNLLKEDHLSTLESHYVNSLLYFYQGDLRKASQCLKKAKLICKRNVYGKRITTSLQNLSERIQNYDKINDDLCLLNHINN